MHHPVTKLFREYLRDHERFIIAGSVDAWINGKLKLAEEHERRVRVMMLRELLAMPWQAFERFYGVEVKDETS